MKEPEKEHLRKRLQRLAWVLDSSIPIPGLGGRVGLDGLIGLFPGIGDTLGALCSSYILSEAGRLGAPRSLLIRMAYNIALDALIGAIPVLGDVFDLVWKANQRNVRLLEDYLERPRKSVVTSRLFAWTLALLLIAFVIFVGLLGFLLIRWLWLQLGGG